MKKIVIIEKGKDGSYSAYSYDTNTTIVGEGATASAAKIDFNNAFNELMAYYNETGETIPDELCDVEWEYKYDVASVFDYFDFINVTKFAKRAGINASLMRQYKTRDMYISEAQAAKIQNALQTLGKEMAAVLL